MTGRKDAVKYTDLPETFAEDAAHMTNDALSVKYQRSITQIVRWRHTVNVQSPVPGGNPKYRWSFPDPNAKNYAEAGTLLLEGDCVVTSDWHIPYHDIDLCEKMVRVASKKKIRQLAIVGDLFDAATLSIFEPQDIEFGIREELNSTAETLKHLLKFFSRIYWSVGNHEMRLLRMLKFSVDLVDVGKWLLDNPKLVLTPLPQMYLDAGTDRWRLTHPSSYSRVPTRVAVQIASKYQCNVMSAHGHLFGETIDTSGKYRAIDLGGLFDENKIAYKNVKGDTTHPRAMSGFWIVKDGLTTGFSRTTNWTSVFPEDAPR